VRVRWLAAGRAGLADRMRRVVPPLTLAAALVALAASPGLETGLGIVDAVGRVVLHLVLYAALFVLLRQTLRGRDATAAVLALAVGVADELIQSTVPGRDATPVDVLVDAAGIGLGALFVRRRRGRPA
jgi:VanZ family protein